jgi:dTDP-4-dehydrorhamnose reductase
MSGQKILLLGSTGQLGQTLKQALKKDYVLTEINRPELVFLDKGGLKEKIRKLNPQIIINSSAFTAVDLAEKKRKEAEIANFNGPSFLAKIAKELDSLLIHFSTDYVFNGFKKQAYKETDKCNPLNVYGETKRRGELAILESNCKCLILRTGWVYSHLRSNFLLTILKLASSKSTIKVINDQFGSPTSTEQISLICLEFTKKYLKGDFKDFGLFHLSALGKTSWYGFASEILDQAEKLGFDLILSKENVVPVTSEEYGAEAMRPKNSFLDVSKLLSLIDVDLFTWQAELSKVLKKVDLNRL